VARILIVGGGCRGRALAGGLLQDGHAVRITTRSEQGRAAIEELGAECWVGTPDRLATLRGSLDRVAIACWLLGSAQGPGEELAALYTTRLELFLTQAIDTTVRGVVYEPAGVAVPDAAAAEGDEIARRLTELNRIPFERLSTAPAETDAWIGEARKAVDGLLAAAL
jgi:nucleoside-diphosphate-sugar epimerase